MFLAIKRKKLLKCYKLFQTNDIDLGGLSKVTSAVLSVFQKRIVHQKHIWQILKLLRLDLTGF